MHCTTSATRVYSAADEGVQFQATALFNLSGRGVQLGPPYSTAAKDLQELGVNYTQEQLDQIKQAEEQRLRQRKMEREAKEREQLAERYEDCDGRFAFIAGYTDGGAPYGVMWEEVGIDPGLPFEEKVKLYRMQM